MTTSINSDLFVETITSTDIIRIIEYMTDNHNLKLVHCPLWSVFVSISFCTFSVQNSPFFSVLHIFCTFINFSYRANFLPTLTDEFLVSQSLFSSVSCYISFGYVSSYKPVKFQIVIVCHWYI